MKQDIAMSECIQKLIKYLYFVHLFHYPSKKREKRIFSNDIKLGHLSFKWLLETVEAKTCFTNILIDHVETLA